MYKLELWYDRLIGQIGHHVDLSLVLAAMNVCITIAFGCVCVLELREAGLSSHTSASRERKRERDRNANTIWFDNHARGGTIQDICTPTPTTQHSISCLSYHPASLLPKLLQITHRPGHKAKPNRQASTWNGNPRPHPWSPNWTVRPTPHPLLRTVRSASPILLGTPVLPQYPWWPWSPGASPSQSQPRSVTRAGDPVSSHRVTAGAADLRLRARRDKTGLGVRRV
jgi:hypothetical protein